MSDRRNFTMDDEAAELLDTHSEDNHSELVRELLKEYYSVGVYDTEQAALCVRKSEIDRQLTEMEAQVEALQEEREQLSEITDEGVESDVEAVASEIRIADPEMADASNPGIRRQAEQNGIAPEVLAEVVREQAVSVRRSGLKSLSDD